MNAEQEKLFREGVREYNSNYGLMITMSESEVKEDE
jgi:hypothetical protein